jgi:RND family efflux transporter MFP subunit
MGVAAAAVASLLCAGCGNAPGPAAASTPVEQAPLQLAAEDVLVLGLKSLAAGPAITGSILPEKRADLRAEVSAVVLAVLKENGDPVRRGDLLVRLDDTAIRDTLASSATAARAATQAYEQAQRQYERMVKLRESGLVSTQQVEDAEVRRNSAQSDREAARSRQVAAQQQQQRTLVRAPFDGIVSDRQASAGDTAQIGKELLKVIDPASLRFEGYVSAGSVGLVKAGQKVSFRIHGIEGRQFSGTITRVNPAANALTRQVEVLVAFTRGEQPPGVAGLYAEGRVEISQSEGLSLPASVIVRDGDDAHAWLVKGGRLHKAKLQLGERDPRTGEVIVASGVAAGDAVLRYPSSILHDGQPARLAGG